MALNKPIFVASLFFCSQILLGQSIPVKDIKLKNASFEDMRGSSKLPLNWSVCLKAEDMLPDIQPGSFGVKLPPFQGKTYVSLTAKDNGGCEEMRQNLGVTLKAGNCYRLSVYLAKSENYISQSQANGQMSNFNKPLKLEIFGLKSDSCMLQSEDWIVETKAVHHYGWKKYIFNVQLSNDCNILVFKVKHADDKPYNGNLLIDNVSDIRLIECEDYKIGNQKGKIRTNTFLDFLNETILNNGSQMKFGKKRITLISDGFNVGDGIMRNAYFDRIIEVFEKYKNYKLIIRVKKNSKYTQKRVIYLYNYIFKFTKLKSQSDRYSTL
jgi:hypothetical protein